MPVCNATLCSAVAQILKKQEKEVIKKKKKKGISLGDIAPVVYFFLLAARRKPKTGGLCTNSCSLLELCHGYVKMGWMVNVSFQRR